MDVVVVSGLVIVALVCVMATYITIFAYKHIKQDTASAQKENSMQGK